MRHDSDCRRAISGRADSSSVEQRTYCICLTNETGPRVDQEKIRVFMTEKQTLLDLANADTGCDFAALSDTMEYDWKQKSATEKTSELDSYQNWVDFDPLEGASTAGGPSDSMVGQFSEKVAEIMARVPSAQKLKEQFARSRLRKSFTGPQPTTTSVTSPQTPVEAESPPPVLPFPPRSVSATEQLDAAQEAGYLLKQFPQQERRFAFKYWPGQEAGFMKLVLGEVAKLVKESGNKPPVLLLATGGTADTRNPDPAVSCNFLLSADHDPGLVKRLWPELESTMQQGMKKAGVQGTVRLSKQIGCFEGEFKGKSGSSQWSALSEEGHRTHQSRYRHPVWIGSGLRAAEVRIRRELWRNVDLKSLPQELLGGIKPEFQFGPNWKRWQTLVEVACCLKDQKEQGSRHMVWEVSVFVPKAPPPPPPSPFDSPRKPQLSSPTPTTPQGGSPRWQ